MQGTRRERWLARELASGGPVAMSGASASEAVLIGNEDDHQEVLPTVVSINVGREFQLSPIGGWNLPIRRPDYAYPSNLFPSTHASSPSA